MRTGRPVRRWLALVAVVTACTATQQSVAPTGAPASAASASPEAAAAAKTVAFPDVPLVLGTPAGDLYFALVDGRPSGTSVHACDSPITQLAAVGRRALFFCGDPWAHYRMLIWDGDTRAISDLGVVDEPIATLEGSDAVVRVAIGRSEPPAPISMTRLVRRDLRTLSETTVDERYGVALGLRATDDGVAVWRPRNSLSFARPEAEAGTWLLRGTTLTKLSAHRLVDGRPGEWVLESEVSGSPTGYSTSATSSPCCSYVLRGDRSGERRLTPADVPNEQALAMLADGRVVAWRVGVTELDGNVLRQRGSVVVYRGTSIERIDPGPFTGGTVWRSGTWLVGQVPTTGTLSAYRVSDGAFAQAPLAGVSSFTVLAPRP